VCGAVSATPRAGWETRRRPRRVRRSRTPARAPIPRAARLDAPKAPLSRAPERAPRAPLPAKMAPRPASGVSRRPERFGGSVRNEKRDELRRALEAFEARVDKNDPEQVAALEAMRAETRELERMRGVWCATGPDSRAQPFRVDRRTAPSFFEPRPNSRFTCARATLHDALFRFPPPPLPLLSSPSPTHRFVTQGPPRPPGRAERLERVPRPRARPRPAGGRTVRRVQSAQSGRARGTRPPRARLPRGSPEARRGVTSDKRRDGDGDHLSGNEGDFASDDILRVSRRKRQLSFRARRARLRERSFSARAPPPT